MAGIAITPHAVVEAWDDNTQNAVGVDAVLMSAENGQLAAPQSAKEFVLALPRCAYTCARATCKL